jgi:hypothetical protein
VVAVDGEAVAVAEAVAAGIGEGGDERQGESQRNLHVSWLVG